MKIPCEVIEDLLPLYQDGGVSETSKRLLEAHLKECRDCRRKLSLMKEPINLPPLAVDEAKPMKAVARGITKKRRRAVLWGVLVTALVLCGVFFGWLKFYEYRRMTEAVPVSEVEVLSSGTTEDGLPEFTIGATSSYPVTGYGGGVDQNDKSVFVLWFGARPADKGVERDDGEKYALTMSAEDWLELPPPAAEGGVPEGEAYSDLFSESIQKVVYRDDNGGELVVWEKD